MTRYFSLEYWEEDGWFVGRLKDVPGVFSQGETLAELKDNIADAYRMMMEAEPEPDRPGALTVEMGVEI